jgi:hypothetical protein
LFHDLTAEKALWCFKHLRAQSLRPSTQITPLKEWPKTSSAFIACTSDRALYPEWAFSVPSKRYGIPTFAIGGGHSPWASRPKELAEMLVALASPEVCAGSMRNDIGPAIEDTKSVKSRREGESMNELSSKGTALALSR